MLRSTCLLVLGLASATCALESSYTGPMFNPSEAPYFAQTGLVVPTQTDLPAIQPTDAFSMATTISGIILPTTLSRSSTASLPSSSQSSSHSSSSAASSSASRTASNTLSSAISSASSSAPAQQSTGAAVANRVGLMGTIGGALLAGLVLP
ncbi:hypothetical protein SVAN01_04432 [Stagonosporopsis vannaccii]|nr:hypothetical protein SVAN01_04432 [Stagonosporopsis vannaccii]